MFWLIGSNFPGICCRVNGGSAGIFIFWIWFDSFGMYGYGMYAFLIGICLNTFSCGGLVRYGSVYFMVGSITS